MKKRNKVLGVFVLSIVFLCNPLLGEDYKDYLVRKYAEKDRQIAVVGGLQKVGTVAGVAGTAAGAYSLLSNYPAESIALGIGLGGAYGIGYIATNAYDKYIQSIDNEAQALKEQQDKLQRDSDFGDKLKDKEPAKIKSKLMQEIGTIISKRLNLNIEGCPLFPTAESRIFVLQNIQDFFTFEPNSKLNAYVYEASIKEINRLEQQLRAKVKTDRDIVIDEFRKFFIKNQSKPFSEMNKQELELERNKKQETLNWSKERRDTLNDPGTEPFEEAVGRLMQDGAIADYMWRGKRVSRLFFDTLMALKCTALASLIAHIELMLKVGEKEQPLFQSESLLSRVEELEARNKKAKYAEERNIENQSAAIATALNTRAGTGKGLIPIAQEGREKRDIAFAAVQQAKETSVARLTQERKAFEATQEAKRKPFYSRWWSNITSYFSRK